MDARKVRLLVTDYDLCAIAYNGSEPDMLSRPFVEFAQRKPYAGFYGVTHRAVRH